MQPLYTQKRIYIQKFRSTSTGKEQEQTQGWLKGPCYPVFVLSNEAGALWVSGCTCANAVLPCTRYPPRLPHAQTHILPVLYKAVTAAVFWSRPTRKGSGKSRDGAWNTPICPTASAISKKLLQTPLFQKRKPQFHFPTKPENIKK